MSPTASTVTRVRADQPFFLEGEHIAIDLDGARALFTTRRGGVSSGPYASLNLGLLTGDDPVAVRRNREAVQEQIGARFAYGRQVHGAVVAVAASAGPPLAGSSAATPATLPAEELPAADGQVTDRRGVAPMVLTADCLPVAIAAPGGVGVLHAGWRGLAGGVLEAGVRRLREIAPQGAIRAAIGPGAGPCCYEVGEEVHAHFAGVAGARRGGHLDLKRVARELLERAGVAEVHDCALCTMCSDGSWFFSHRRDRGTTGRQAGVAWLR